MQSESSLKNILRISLPIMFSMLALNIISVTDIVFISRYASGFDKSVSDGMIGAVGIGSIYHFCMFMIGSGFATGVQILVARRNGERNYRRIGGIVESGMMFLWILAVILIAFSLVIAPVILPSFIDSPEVVAGTSSFLTIRIFGLIFSYINLSLRSFHVGVTDTKPITYTTVLMAASNVVLNYALTFGRFGLPEMGIKGIAAASVIAEFSGALFFVMYNLKKSVRLKYRLFAFDRVNAATIKNILRISIYVMLQYAVSMFTWLAFFLVIEKAGKVFLDSSQLARSVYSLVSIPGWAYAVTVNTLVSNAIGKGEVDSVMKIILKMIKISFVTAAITVSILFCFSENVLSIFSDNPELIGISNESVTIITGAILVFSVSTIPFNGISGTGKTGVAMFIEMISLLIYGISIYIMFDVFLNRPAGFWYSEYVYWGFLALFSYIYLYSGRWKKGIREI